MADQLGSAVLTLSVDDAQFQAGLSRARQATAGFGQQFNSAFSGGAAQTLTGLNIKLNSLQDELQRVAIGSQRFRELRAEINSTEQALNRATGAGAGFAGKLATGLAGLGVGAGLASFFKESIQGAAELETTTRRLQNALGAEGAGGAISFLRGVSDELGVNFRTLTSTFAGFTAAATAAGVPLTQQKELFEAVATSAQRLGLSNVELQGSFLALQQVAAKGVVQMEELRGQLGERLPTAFAATARGLGITSQQLIKLVESGQLTSTQFFEALTKGLQSFNQEVVSNVPTAAQNFEALKNAWQDLQASFGQSLLPGITQQIKDLVGAFEGLKIAQGGEDIKMSFGIGNVEQAQALAKQLQDLRQEFNLTQQEANNLLSDALAGKGQRNIFGELKLSADEAQAAIGELRSRADEFTASRRAAQAAAEASNAAAVQAADQAAKDAERAGNSLKSLQLLQKEAQAAFASAQTGSPEAKAAAAEYQRVTELIKQAAADLEGSSTKVGETLSASASGFDKVITESVVVAGNDLGTGGTKAGEGIVAGAKEAAGILSKASTNTPQVSAAIQQNQSAVDSPKLTTALELASNVIGKSNEALNQVIGKIPELGAKFTPLATALDGLTKKDWNVNVAVNANTGAYAVKLG